MTQFTRTFHPVGQGAFYSEVHRLEDGREFIVVYDCGTNTADVKSRLKKEVHSALKTEDVDILFISHFDADHVNGIQYLKPKIIVLPILSDDEKFVFSIMSAIDGNDYDSNIEQTIRNYFSANRLGVKILKVDKYSERREYNNAESLNLSDLNDGDIIQSGQHIGIHNAANGLWTYIPFNFDMNQAKLQTLIGEIKNNNIDINRIKADAKYLSSNIDTLKAIFGRYGNLNNHSMVLYSGTINADEHYTKLFHGRGYCCCRRCYCRYVLDNCGCVYFGDITINRKVVDGLNAGLRLLQDNVTTIQVPHHGSKKSYKSMMFDKLKNVRCCAISFGKNNSYGHPSSYVVGDILRSCKCVKYVTEDKDSIFMQNTEY
jgi:beta-lactamase superfamily II metal-dependent hydrolase